MSNEQYNPLPEYFKVQLQKHGDNWHVTRLHDYEYPLGDLQAQPDWDIVQLNLNGLGYEAVHEGMVSLPGQRLVEMGRTQKPTIYDAIAHDDFSLDDTATKQGDNVLRDVTRRKFGRL